MNSPRTTLKAFTDAAADAVAREIAGMRREAARERELREAEHRARMAELEARLMAAADLERRLAERMAELRDGSDGADGRDGIDGSPGVDGRDGVDGSDGADGRDVEDIEVRQDGATVEFAFTVGDARSVFEVELPQGPAGEKGEQGQEGKMASVEPWQAGIAYQGAIRTHAGGTWQALKDTASEPGGEGWACLAAPGATGRDGEAFTVRGLFAVDAEYKRLDVVMQNGASFVAERDAPATTCPGDGWRLLAKQGGKGDRGDKGERGERGLPGPAVVAMDVDDEGVVTLRHSDGSTVQCDLYPVLSRIAFKGL